MTSTAYTYDPFGNLASVTDPSGNIVTMTYDIRGHKTGENDPDKGAWSFGYDALGSVVSRKDAMVSGSNTVNFTYDLLERPLTETGFVSPTSTWIWDTSSYGVGKLAKACTNACGTADYSRTESYDLYGHPSSTAITVDGTTYTTATGYDSSGRLSTTTYPSGQVVSYTYHGDGYLAGIKNGVGGPGLWTVGQRDAYLNATQQTYGNGIVTNQGFDPAMGGQFRFRWGRADRSGTWDTPGTWRATSRPGRTPARVRGSRSGRPSAMIC